MEESEEIIELPYASFISRTIAFIIDYLLISFILGVILSIIKPLGFAFEGPEVMEYNEETIRELRDAAGPIMPFFFVGMWLYNAIMHASRWQATLGKRFVGIVVTDLDGERINFLKASLRFAGKLVSMMILLVGFLLAAITSRRQALHDLIGGTVVLKYRT